MPEAAVQAEPTFADFRANPDILKHAPVERKDPPADPAKSRTQNLEAAKDAPTEEPTSEPVAGSDPDLQQSSKFEQRKAAMQREIDAKRRELGDIERELAARKAPAGEPRPAEQAQPAKRDGADAADPKPSQSDAKYSGPSGFEDYMADVVEWKNRARQRAADQEKAQAAEAESKAKAEADYGALKKKFEDRGSEYASQPGNEDYPELVEKFRQTKVSKELEAAVLMPEDGPGFLHHLLKNPDELKRIEAFPTPIERFEAIFEEKFKLKYPERGKPAAERPKSQAPAPGTYLTGRGAAPRGDPKSLNDIGSLAEARKLVRRS